MLDHLGCTIIDNRPKSEFDTQLESYVKDLAVATNKNSMERFVGLPDFIIGQYLAECFRTLCATNAAVWQYNEAQKEQQ